MPRVAIEESQRLGRRFQNVTSGLEYREAFVLREDAGGAPRRHRRREDIEIAADPAQCRAVAAAIFAAAANPGRNRYSLFNLIW